MSSKKKRNKNKAANQNQKIVKKNKMRYPEYVTWVISAGVFALSLIICVAAKYSLMFGMCFSIINGALALLAANYLRSEDFVFGKSNMFSRRSTWVVLSGLLASLSVLLMYISLGMRPFGELTVVSGDMANQYIPFAVARNKALLSGDSLFYSESLGLGGNFWSVFVYYVSSPFMLFSLFVDAKDMDMFMLIMQIIKIGAAGGAFAYFYTEKFDRRDASAAVFSLAYALMSFSVSNMLNVIWLDCIMMLPLIILGAERVMQKKSAELYVICLAWAIITCYYLAFMICIYLVMYYIAYTVIHTEKFKFSDQIKNLGRFAAFSLLGVGISASMIIPSVFALVTSTSDAHKSSVSGILSYNPLKLIARFLWGSTVSYKNESLPNVYCSILVPIFVILFLVCRKIPRRKKVVLSAIAAVLMISTMLSYVNYAWHGFHETVGLPYRYSFLISFTLLIMAAEAVQYAEDIDIVKVTGVTCGLAAVIFAVYFLDYDSGESMLLVSAVMLLLYIALIACGNMKFFGRSAVAALALVLMFGEMTFSGVNIVEQINNFNTYATKLDYDEIFYYNEQIINDIKVSDSDVYRIEDENYQTANQSIYFDYGSLSYYVTSNNGALIDLMDALGYATLSNKYTFNAYVPFTDSLLNVKYILSADDNERSYLELTNMSNNGKNVYQNTIVLPRAFAVSSDLSQWDISEKNSFVVQNSLAKLSTGIDKDIYEIITQENTSGETENGSFVIKGSSYTAEYILPRDGDLYCFFECLESEIIVIEFNGERYDVNGETSGIMPLKDGKKGDKLTITVYGRSGLEGLLSAALLNDAAFCETMEALSETPMKFSEYGNGEISGTINIEEDCLLFTSIPYDEGWNVYVNGEKSEIVSIGGGLMGVKLAKGQNEIEMKYSVQGLSAGIWVSLISVVLLIGYVVCRKKGIDVSEFKQLAAKIKNK